MSANYVRDVLLTMDTPQRRALAHVVLERVKQDPAHTDLLTVIWWAIWCQISDLDTEEAALFEQLRPKP